MNFAWVRHIREIDTFLLGKVMDFVFKKSKLWTVKAGKPFLDLKLKKTKLKKFIICLLEILDPVLLHDNSLRISHVKVTFTQQ